MEAMNVLYTEMRTRLKKPSGKQEALKELQQKSSHPLSQKELGKKIILPEFNESWVLKERPGNRISGHGEIWS